jgi:hypothetical protein
MKFKIIVFLVTSYYCFGHELPNKALLNNNHIFALLCVHEDKTGGICHFEISDLLKSKFPQGPIRYNKVVDKLSLDDLRIKEIEKNSWELHMLCVKDKEGKAKVKCGFESLDNPHLAYVFSLSNDIKEIKGFIILRTIYESILENGVIDRSLYTEELVDQEGYEEEPGEEELFWDDEPPVFEREEPNGFFEKLYVKISKISVMQKSALWAIMKYIEIKKSLGSIFG